LEFGNVSFGAGARGNLENLERNLSKQGELIPLMTPCPGFKLGPHWWKGSALTTAHAPSL